MMRLARRASLLVALYLLTSAATAYAECAWVLWQTVEVVNRFEERLGKEVAVVQNEGFAPMSAYYLETGVRQRGRGSSRALAEVTALHRRTAHCSDLLPRHHGPARAEGEMNNTDARLWHPWLRINRVLRAMLSERWSAEAWPQVKAEFKKALTLKSQIRRAGWFN